MKKFLFWTVVIVGILAAVAAFMKRRSDLEDGSWQGDLEDYKGSVTKAVNDAMSEPNATEKANETVDAAVEGTKDAIDRTGDTAKDTAGKAKDVAKDVGAKAKRASS